MSFDTRLDVLIVSENCSERRNFLIKFFIRSWAFEFTDWLNSHHSNLIIIIIYQLLKLIYLPAKNTLSRQID